jgi:hypothetical protein
MFSVALICTTLFDRLMFAKQIEEVGPLVAALEKTSCV